MKVVFHYLIRNKGRLCVIREDQLLLYVREEEKVEKSCIIHILEIGFTFLNKKNELIVIVATRCAAKSIRGSIMHIALNINTYKARSSHTNVSGI